MSTPASSSRPSRKGRWDYMSRPGYDPAPPGVKYPPCPLCGSVVTRYVGGKTVEGIRHDRYGCDSCTETWTVAHNPSPVP